MGNCAVLSVSAALAALLMAGPAAHAADPKPCDLPLASVWTAKNK